MTDGRQLAVNELPTKSTATVNDLPFVEIINDCRTNASQRAELVTENEPLNRLMHPIKAIAQREERDERERDERECSQ